MSNIFLDEIMRREEKGHGPEFREMLHSSDLQTLALMAIAWELSTFNFYFRSILRERKNGNKDLSAAVI